MKVQGRARCPSMTIGIRSTEVRADGGPGQPAGVGRTCTGRTRMLPHRGDEVPAWRTLLIPLARGPHGFRGTLGHVEPRKGERALARLRHRRRGSRRGRRQAPARGHRRPHGACRAAGCGRAPGCKGRRTPGEWSSGVHRPAMHRGAWGPDVGHGGGAHEHGGRGAGSIRPPAAGAFIVGSQRPPRFAGTQPAHTAGSRMAPRRIGIFTRRCPRGQREGVFMLLRKDTQPQRRDTTLWLSPCRPVAGRGRAPTTWHCSVPTVASCRVPEECGVARDGDA